MILLLWLALAVDDAAVGVWKFQAALSDYQSAPAPRESTRQWIDLGDKIRFVHDGVSADGKKFHTEFTAGFDGQRGTVTGSGSYDSVVLKRMDRRHVAQTFRKGDVVTVEATREISPDGKRMTIIATGKRADGKPFKNTLVYFREK